MIGQPPGDLNSLRDRLDVLTEEIIASNAWTLLEYIRSDTPLGAQLRSHLKSSWDCDLEQLIAMVEQKALEAISEETVIFRRAENELNTIAGEQNESAPIHPQVAKPDGAAD